MRSPRLFHHVRRAGRRVAIAALLMAALWGLTASSASAHAHLVQADPAPDSVIAHAPAVASFLFDEPLNPALTRVRIVDASGRPVRSGSGYLAPGHNGELWELVLPSLASGTYSVFWTSESATDGHVMSSFYTFRVSATSGPDSTGAVTGAASGSYGGGSDATTGGLLTIGGGAVATALFSWLGLMAQALWLGALVIELAVLTPARRRSETPAPRLWWLVRGALVAAAIALVLEVVSLAVQGTGGDWGQALAPATLGGILSSRNGHAVLLRAIALLAALSLAWSVNAPTSATAAAISRRARHSPRALGIAAPMMSVPRWESMRGLLVLLATAYMALVALSGHATDVTPGWLSYPIDWLHLLFTAAWAGGIAALAFGVLPARRLLPPEERAPAVLHLLDRFSIVAYSAIGILALSGLYNAVNHLDSPSMLANTAYGQLLVLKLVLVGLLILLSASHVFLLRPRLATLSRTLARETRALAHGHVQDRGGYVATIAATLESGATVHEGLATLAARLRLETGVGAAILLATALMGQTLPANSLTVAATATVPASITGGAALADLRARLTVAPPAVGATTFTLLLWERGTPVSAANGVALIHLYPVAQPSVRASLTPAGAGTRFTVHGSLAIQGAWRADVLVRTALVNEYRTLPFTFTVGPGAAFLAPGLTSDAITMAVSPGLMIALNTITVTGVHAPAVRLLSQSLDMQMGIQPYATTPLGQGRWRATGVVPLMVGRWGFTVQAWQDGAWVSLRQFAYQVPYSGPMRLITDATVAAAPTATTVLGTAAPAWTPVNGPHTVIHVLVRAPWGTLYAGVSGAVYASADGGLTWHAVGQGFPSRAVEVWGVTAVSGPHGDAVLGAAGDGAIYRLERGGTRWRRAGPPIGSTGAFALFALPRSDVVLAGSDRGIFRSTDGGWSWAVVALADGGAVLAFARDPTSGALYAGLAGVTDTLRVSQDGGRSWQILPTPVPPPSVETLIVAGGRLYAGVMGAPGGRAVWVSSAEGFTPYATGLPHDAHSMAMAATSGAGGRLFAGTMTEGIYSRTPRGAWTRLGSIPGDGDVTSLLVLPGPRPVVLAGLDSGIYRLQLP